MFTPASSETEEEGQAGGDASLWTWTSPETETGERCRVYASQNEWKGHEDRRTGTERGNKAGKK